MTRDNEIWMDLDALAASYERIHGQRPNRLRLGGLVADKLEGGTLPEGHPLHLDWESAAAGVWFPARPAQAPTMLGRYRQRRACRRSGGHWWHPADAMILWFCCRCGADRDGLPRDGT